MNIMLEDIKKFIAMPWREKLKVEIITIIGALLFLHVAPHLYFSTRIPIYAQPVATPHPQVQEP